MTDGTVRLSNEAWLSDGQNEISGPLLVYNIRGQTMQAESAPGGQRVHITITQPSAPPGDKGGEARPAPEGARPQPRPQP